MRTVLLQAVSLLLILTTLLSCEKQDRDWVNYCETPVPAWLHDVTEKIDCSCPSTFRTGMYNGQRIFEQSVSGPACDGITTVFNAEGTILFTSLDASFADYLYKVEELCTVWKCPLP